MKYPSASTVFRWAAAIVLLSLLLWALRHYSEPYAEPFARWVRARGAWGPVAFIAAYIVAGLLLIPGTILSLVGGALFGFARGVVYTFTGAMLASVASFFVARYAVRPLVERRLRRNRRFEAIDRAAAGGGKRLVALLRLSPVLPYNVLNYALGITRIATWDYIVGSAAILPGAAMYTYYGTVAGTLTGLSGPVRRGAGFYTLMAVGVVATVVAAVFVARLAKSKLGELEHAG